MFLGSRKAFEKEDELKTNNKRQQKKKKEFKVCIIALNGSSISHKIDLKNIIIK